LKGQRFLRSTPGESANVEEQHHWLLAHEVGEFNGFRRGRRQAKIRGLITPALSTWASLGD